jgi:hypothetical protein
MQQSMLWVGLRAAQVDAFGFGVVDVEVMQIDVIHVRCAAVLLQQHASEAAVADLDVIDLPAVRGA